MEINYNEIRKQLKTVGVDIEDINHKMNGPWGNPIKKIETIFRTGDRLGKFSLINNGGVMSLQSNWINNTPKRGVGQVVNYIYDGLIFFGLLDINKYPSYDERVLLGDGWDIPAIAKYGSFKAYLEGEGFEVVFRNLKHYQTKEKYLRFMHTAFVVFFKDNMEYFEDEISEGMYKETINFNGAYTGKYKDMAKYILYSFSDGEESAEIMDKENDFNVGFYIKNRSKTFEEFMETYIRDGGTYKEAKEKYNLHFAHANKKELKEVIDYLLDN